ncbi:metallophosphoesterase family protein [Frankia sp. AgB1.9]|uniref:purple acid phosphatase family protein n=1 Tax=unclassified Frankia TaxID=2632575 RepID=UPI001931513C|nr:MULTISPECIES: metallophosphoesterase family protein [unclassified Frankia]MBL7492369.1 metallophosphoesterase family protein [Frankia sp. AgW1.1]MBL7546976.1 metallophosphoesterase family protein [Frankia sp. AgB1.9]MBL7625129.1 metallophosphoesterase family protein [Frankia sp. AgB1.8]
MGSGVHLTFGPDPATSMVVSWLADGEPAAKGAAAGPAGALSALRQGLRPQRPAVRFAPAAPDSAPLDPVPDDDTTERAHATTSTFRDAARRRHHVHHARLDGLRPGTRYRYTIEPAPSNEPATGEFRTAAAPGDPDEAFTFTCFGDHGTDEPDDPYGTAASRAVVGELDRHDPLFNLVIGDLTYASLRQDPAQAWADWFRMIAPSARRRPWMPVAGNHESERGMGRFGLTPYQAYFASPPNDAGPDYEGLWYAFTVGRARFVMLFGEDVCYQDHGEVYLHGFSEGRQTAWLERTLRDARADDAIDWVIVGVHQVAMSTAAYHNGGDLGLRAAWLPLFDRYQVDLVLCGHEHHYERTQPVRGVVPGSTELTPLPAVTTEPAIVSAAPLATARPVVGSLAARPAGGELERAELERIDATTGTVHVTIGTGGSSTPSTEALFDPPAGRVVVEAEKRPGAGRRRTIYRLEAAPWLAARSTEHPYAFAALRVDPGEPGGTTTIRVTVHDSLAPDEPPFDEFMLTRPRGEEAGSA